MSADGVVNTNANPSNIIVIIKETKLHVTAVNLSARDNQKAIKTSLEILEKLAYWNEYKTKSENKNTVNKYRYFLESNCVGANRLYVLVYSNQDIKMTMLKGLKLEDIIYQEA